MRPVLAAGLLLALAAACGGSGGGQTSGPAATVGSSIVRAPSGAPSTGAGEACTTDATEGEEVLIAGFQYQPADLTVPAGTAVAWTNTDADPHTVTFADGPDCGAMDLDDTVALTFDEVGTFSYICSFHPNMRGSITVE